MSEVETPVTALATIEKLTPPQLFAAGALDPIIDRIKQECLAIPRDISTPEGRKIIASTAFKIARSKTFIDAQRKALVADKKKEVSIIDKEGARVWDELESFQKEFRKPLTDWENAEKERVAAHEQTILELQTLIDRVQGQQSTDIECALEYASHFDTSLMQEFRQRAEATRTSAVAALEAYLAKTRRAEEEAAELVRLRQEAAERAERDRIEAAARQAREEAERAAKEREEAAERKAAEERDRAKREQMRVESEKKLMEERAVKAEQDRMAFEERTKREMAEADARAKQAAEEAAKKAAADQKAAVEAERQRVAAIAKQKADEEKARKKDTEHKAAIHNAILAALSPAHITPDDAKLVIRLIAQGKVPHVTIQY